MPSILATKLGLRHPVLQAPMAGGMTTPALVAAVSGAGGLGCVAGAVLAPEAIAADAAAVRVATDRPFGINLFVLPPERVDRDAIARSHQALRPIRDALGIEADPEPNRYAQDGAAQLDAVVALAPLLASFTFGLLPRADIARLQRAGCLVMGTATNLAEALAWEEAGADAVCAQGVEAGGHRGTFVGGRDDGALGTLALVPRLASALRIPVVAAGGIMDGRGIAAALALGADAVQLGTAFLNTAEAALAEPYRAALRAAEGDATRLTRAFSGRYARGIDNAFIRHMAAIEAEMPDYPVQNALTADIRAASARAGLADYLSLWAGQGVGLLRLRPERQPAAALMADLVAEAGAVLASQP